MDRLPLQVRIRGAKIQSSSTATARTHGCTQQPIGRQGDAWGVVEQVVDQLYKGKNSKGREVRWKMRVAFATPSVVRLPQQSARRRHACGTTRRHRAPQCATQKLLVVDLQEVFRQADNADDDFRGFTQRVEVDRERSKEQTYVLYSSVSGYEASMKSVRDAGLAEPDALTTLNGTELYQRQYRTPDPYWAQTVCSGWTSRPVEWVVKKFFEEEVKQIDCSVEFLVKLTCKGDNPSVDFCTRVGKKLKEMGISSRVILGESGADVNIVPAAGSAADVIAYCQMMLKIKEDCTFVFGGDDLINACVQGKGNVGLCTAGSQQGWEAFDGRVYVSKEFGVKALMDGVLHHAVF